jgi:hypothetical protein
MEPKAVGFLDFAIVQKGKEKREKRKDRDFGFAAAIGGKEERRKRVFSLSWCVLSRSRSVLYMNLWGCLTSTRFSRALEAFSYLFF